MRKILITGITGFAGSYLTEYLIQDGSSFVFGTYLQEPNVNIFSPIPIKKNLKLIKLDLLDAKKVASMIHKYKPDVVFHLAALASPADSFKNPVEIVTNNIAAQINLLETIHKSNLFTTKILVVSSGDIYGIVDKKDLPIDEKTSLQPTNPYAVSKLTQDFLALQYFLSYKLKIIRVRPFNHIGPRQSPSFVVSAFAKKIAEIEKRKREPILFVGSLESRRDFTDVRDMVKAYVLAIEKGKAGDVYNIGSGVAYKISDILNKLISFSAAKITIKSDKSLFRPSDSPELICNAQKFTKLTEWRPKINLDKTLKDTLDYWRNII